MAAITVKPVASAAEEKLFLRLPERLYADDPNWVCPLRIERRDFFNPKKNPFFDEADVQLFLAYRDERIVGRISAHLYPAHNRVHNETVGFFGFFDCENDYTIAEALLQAAAAWIRARGMTTMRGPANFTTNHEVGTLVEGFDRPPVVMMTYNPRYYPEFLERFGLAKAMDLYAYETDADNPPPERVARLIGRIRTRTRAQIRPINLSRFQDEVARVKSIYDRAWAPNWGFVPMSDREFAHTAKDMKQIVDPEIVLFADVDDETVGFSLALPDINQALIRLNGKLLPFGLLKLLWMTKVKKSIDGVRIILMGILPEYQKRGIDYLLYHETFEHGVKRGYRRGEMSWILENNEMMNSVLETLGHRRYKTYRIYDKSLS